MSLRLDGKVAIISGGASGIGAAAVERFVAEGASVVAADRDADKGRELATRLGKAVRFVALDVTHEADWGRTVAECVDAFGRLDVLVNSAGTSGWGSIDDTPVAEWHRTMDVNALGTFLGCRAAVAQMRSTGGGSIVNIASAMAVKADPNQLAYCASKAAVLQLTRSVALHCGAKGYGIRCNAILPGAVDTPLLSTAGELLGGRAQLESAMAAIHPIGRMGEADEIAAAIVFLASGEASFVTASCFAVDGGLAEQ